MAPGNTSHRTRRAALERRQAAAAMASVSTGLMHPQQETLAPPLDDTFPSVDYSGGLSTGATVASGSSERSSALSIRCKKTKLSGVGRTITCEPKTGGGARVNNHAQETEALKRRIAEVRDVVKKSRDMVKKSRDIHKALAERMTKIEAWARSFQAGGQQVAIPTPALGTQSNCNLDSDQDSN